MLAKPLTAAVNTSLQTLNRLPNLIDDRGCEDVTGEVECPGTRASSVWCMRMWFLLTDSRTGYRYGTWTLNIDAVISFINVACKINIGEDDLITLNRSVHTGYWKLNYLPTVLCGMAQLECMNAWMDKQENKRVLMAFQAACDQLWQMVWNWSGSVELRGSSFIFVWRRDEVHLQATLAAIISSPSFYVPQRIVLTLTKMQPSDKNKQQLCHAVGQWMFTQAWVKLLWFKPNQNSYTLYIWMTSLQGRLRIAFSVVDFKITPWSRDVTTIPLHWTLDSRQCGKLVKHSWNISSLT